MTKAIIRTAALTMALAATPLTAVLAGEDPSGEEKAMISEALLAQGFTQWEEITFEDGVWEVEDASSEDGRKYDLKLDRGFNVIDSDS